jgi:hypothetical protein
MRTINHYRTQHYADCVIGEWRLDDVHLCYTLEPPWKGNAHDISCIPTGEYDLVRGSHTSEGKPSYPCYTVARVPDRSNIDVHIGNTPSDTLGCILVGGSVKGHALEDGTSTPAFNSLMHVLDAIHEPLRLKIEDKFEVVGGPRLPDPVPDPRPIDTGYTTIVPHPTVVHWWQRAWAELNGNKRNIAIVLGTIGTAVTTINPLAGSIILALSGILGWVGIGHDVAKETGKEATNDWLAKLFKAIEAFIRAFLAKRGK